MAKGRKTWLSLEELRRTMRSSSKQCEPPRAREKRKHTSTYGEKASIYPVLELGESVKDGVGKPEAGSNLHRRY
jgi:hypothetical protein